MLAMLDLYSVADPGQRGLLADLAREGQRKGWWAEFDDLLSAGSGRYLGLEAMASTVRSLSIQTVPALLQTEDYAVAAHSAARPAANLIQARRLAAITMRRQELLQRDETRLHVIIDETALVRPVGSADVMAGQLDHLASVCTAGRVTVQIAGLAAAWPVLCVPFTVLSFADPEAPDAAYISGLDGPQIVKRDREVRELRGTFTALARSAMSATDSACLITELAARPRQRCS
jgi:hypothetical protein